MKILIDKATAEMALEALGFESWTTQKEDTIKAKVKTALKEALAQPVPTLEQQLAKANADWIKAYVDLNKANADWSKANNEVQRIEQLIKEQTALAQPEQKPVMRGWVKDGGKWYEAEAKAFYGGGR